MSHIPNNQILILLHKKMMTHPKGLVIEISCIENGDHGSSCKEHEICGSVLSKDIVMHLWKAVFFFFIFWYTCFAYYHHCQYHHQDPFCSHCAPSQFCSCMIHIIFCRYKFGMQEKRRLHWQFIGWQTVLICIELALNLSTSSNRWTSTIMSWDRCRYLHLSGW